MALLYCFWYWESSRVHRSFPNSRDGIRLAIRGFFEYKPYRQNKQSVSFIHTKMDVFLIWTHKIDFFFSLENQDSEQREKFVKRFLNKDSLKTTNTCDPVILE